MVDLDRRGDTWTDCIHVRSRLFWQRRATSRVDGLVEKIRESIFRLIEPDSLDGAADSFCDRILDCSAREAISEGSI